MFLVGFMTGLDSKKLGSKKEGPELKYSPSRVVFSKAIFSKSKWSKGIWGTENRKQFQSSQECGTGLKRIIRRL